MILKVFLNTNLIVIDFEITDLFSFSSFSTDKAYSLTTICLSKLGFIRQFYF